MFLLGFMASGKTTLARELGKRCQRPVVDLDETIEQAAGESVADIIRKRGEAVFRELEYRVLRSCPGDCIIAGGGGSFISDEVRDYLREAGISTVFLDLPWERLKRRAEAQGVDRPLWENEEKARALLEKRRPIYEQADYHLKLSGDEDQEHIVDLLFDLIPELRCAT